MKFLYFLCLFEMALAKPNLSGKIVGGQEAEPRNFLTKKVFPNFPKLYFRCISMASFDHYFWFA